MTATALAKRWTFSFKAIGQLAKKSGCRKGRFEQSGQGLGRECPYARQNQEGPGPESCSRTGALDPGRPDLCRGDGRKTLGKLSPKWDVTEQPLCKQKALSGWGGWGTLGQGGL